MFVEFSLFVCSICGAIFGFFWVGGRQLFCFVCVCVLLLLFIVLSFYILLSCIIIITIIIVIAVMIIIE